MMEIIGFVMSYTMMFGFTACFINHNDTEDHLTGANRVILSLIWPLSLSFVLGVIMYSLLSSLNDSDNSDPT